MIINLTPHDIHVEFNNKHKVYPASGQIARLSTNQVPVDAVDGFVIYETEVKVVTGYPGEDENLYIVSAVVGLQLAKLGISNYIIPNTTKEKRDREGNILSVDSFHKYIK